LLSLWWPTPAQWKQFLHGDEGVFRGIRPDSLVIDMGTTAVMKTRAFAAQVEALGGAYADAPVSGGTHGAKEGSLTIMAGGEKSFRTCPSYVESFRRTSHPCRLRRYWTNRQGGQSGDRRAKHLRSGRSPDVGLLCRS